jgi:hypothetical protein
MMCRGRATSQRVVWTAVSGGWAGVIVRVLFIATIVAGIAGFLTMDWFVLAH